MATTCYDHLMLIDRATDVVWKVFTATAAFVEWFRSLRQKPKVRQQIIKIMGGTKEGEIVYQLQIDRNSDRPYEVKHTLEGEGKITAISCTPLSTEINTPDFELLEGGLNYKHVHIRLTPEVEGRWGCNLHVCATSR